MGPSFCLWSGATSIHRWFTHLGATPAVHSTMLFPANAVSKKKTTCAIVAINTISIPIHAISGLASIIVLATKSDSLCQDHRAPHGLSKKRKEISARVHMQPCHGGQQLRGSKGFFVRLYSHAT